MTAPKSALPPLEEILAGIEPGRQLLIEFTTFWVPAGRPGLRLSTVDPGAPRRKPRQLCPVIIADEGQTHADLLEIVAGALRLAAGGPCGNVRRWPGNIYTECGRPTGHDGSHRVHGWSWPSEAGAVRRSDTMD